MHTFDWDARHNPGVHRIAGRTLGLIGLGASAQAVAARAAAFGLEIQAWVRNPTKYAELAAQMNVKLVPLDELMSTSDFISIHLPLCDSTYRLVSADMLTKMKPSAVLINTARGAIVDEHALVELLQQHRIAGAALDVFDGIDVFALPGTPASHPLLELDNVILTPHSAGSSVESSLDSKIRGARNAVDVLLGLRPRHIVNDDVIPRKPLHV
jgi:phosphoglycerate dehydrogenase-like enzyme